MFTFRKYETFLEQRAFEGGFCPICEHATLFVRTGPWLRDEYLCYFCDSLPRWRALIAVLENEISTWRSLDVYEAAPGGSSSEKLRRECAGYVYSHYFPDVTYGDTKQGMRSENLECLTFDSKSFDLVITQDVFEHVLRPDLAFREIARVLRPGGAHVFTLPLHSGGRTLSRAVLAADGSLIHIVEPQYHGNPVDPAGALVVTDWGDDVVDFVRDHAGMETEIKRMSDPRLGIVGEFLEVFVSRKF